MKIMGRRFHRIFSRWIGLALAVLLVSFASLSVSAEDTADANSYLKNLGDLADESNKSIFQWKDSYNNRQDLLDSIRKNMQVDAEIADCQNLIQEQLQRIENHQSLSSDWKTMLQNLLKAKQDSLSLEPLEKPGIVELMNVLNNLNSSAENVEVSVKDVDGQLEMLAELKHSLELFAEVLDYLPEYAKTVSKIDYINSRIQQVKEQKPNISEEIRLESNIFTDKDNIDATLQKFFEASSEDQENLVTCMQKLDLETEAYSTDIAVTAVQKNVEMSQTLAEVKEQVLAENAKGKMIGFIGIGIGVVGILMGVLAIVFSLRNQKEEEPIDLTQLASRKDTETLSYQNSRLRDTLEKMENRIDALGKEVDQVKDGIKELSSDTKPHDNPSKPPVLETQKPSVPEPLVLPEALCTLRLEYQSVSPMNSYLKKSPDGEYILYGDGTVGLKKQGLGKVNQMSGWSGKGLLYLFNVELNGREYEERDLENIRGYYVASSVQRRPSVAENAAGNYVLKSKGLIRMEKTL